MHKPNWTDLVPIAISNVAMTVLLYALCLFLGWVTILSRTYLWNSDAAAFLISLIGPALVYHFVIRKPHQDAVELWVRWLYAGVAFSIPFLFASMADTMGLFGTAAISTAYLAAACGAAIFFFQAIDTLFFFNRRWAKTYGGLK
jgi:hypothetical protein